MKVGRYEVTGFLGRGGMAEVFKCSLSGIGGFDKTIVVKRMLPNLVGDPQFVQMFLDEARICARLSHPNIVQVFEVGEMEGVPFLAMEYIHGPTLRHIIRQVRQDRKQNLGHMVKIIAGIALALDHAHNAKGTTGDSLEIVHRDVSPHNIIVSTQGTAKLLDFGVAKAEGRLTQTKGASLKGKFAYMAPEQTEGKVDFRCDIFALGVCLYEGALLRKPFQGDNEAEVLQAVMKGEYQAPREIVPAFPERLEEIIAWAMHQDPEQRCPSVRILHNALENFVSRGEYPSDPESLQAWIGELFPDPAAFAPQGAAAGYGTGSESLSGASGASASLGTPSHPSLVGSGVLEGFTPSQSVIIEKRSSVPWIISMVAVAAAAGIGGVLYMQSQKPEPAPIVAPPVAGDDETAKRFLTEIESLLEERKYSLALTLSKKLEALEVKDAELDIRRTRTIEAVETAGYLAMARAALENGDSESAVERAKKVLERDFENAEARSILKEARGATDESPVVVAEADPGEESGTASRGPRRGKRAGTVSLDSTPATTVYVDDLPVGRSPLSSLKLTPGSHTVEFRAEGYEPVTRSVKVRAGKRAKLSVELRKVATPEPVVVAKVEPPPPVAPPPPVVKKAPEPASVAKAAKPGKPRLPKVHTLRSRKDIQKVFGVIEKEISVRGLVPRARAKNLTAPLARKLYSSFAPGTTVDVYPQGMYWMAVDLHAAGKSPAQIGPALLKAHTTGKVRSYQPKSR